MSEGLLNNQFLIEKKLVFQGKGSAIRFDANVRARIMSVVEGSAGYSKEPWSVAGSDQLIFVDKGYTLALLSEKNDSYK